MSSSITDRGAGPDTVGSDSDVTLHFALTLADGEVIDTTFDKKPARFAVGDGSLLPGFEQKIIGMRAGQRARYTVLPEQGFGMPNPNNVQHLRRGQFADDMDLAPGLVVSFADANRAELPGVVTQVQGDEVVVDFNHPLAGREIIFEVQILEITHRGESR